SAVISCWAGRRPASSRAGGPKGGGVDHGARIFDRETCTHRPEVVGGLMEAEAAALLTAFFRARR
ncbi:MAG: hypothetical protein OXH14_18060, partial [Alphaproteobacteria bacterium]|nr:hypothetical protein [Alphaproteobacteria bacterium]